jgi:lysophospholipase L1-like esterase
VKRYIALGDSISIDDYPRLESGIDGLGAASLFYRELAAHVPGIAYDDLTADGATTDSVLGWQLPQITKSDEETIVTITAGGNDLLMSLGGLHSPAETILSRLRRIVDGVFDRRPNAVILLGTIYDPSDGTNVLEGHRLDREAVWLAAVNDGIRAMAAERIRIADIHRHFLGHGLTAPPPERWYWSGSIIEPSARGAKEVARVWWEAWRAVRFLLF